MRILGIEFGTWSLKAVEMESRFRRLDILDFHEVRLPLQMMDPGDAYRKAVSQLMARLPTHPEKVVTSLPAAQTALRFLSIPIKQRSRVEKMFRFELEDTIPFKLDQSIVEHYVMSKKDGSVVFAAIAPEYHVQNHVEWLHSVGVDPDWLTFEGMGIINLYLSQQLAAKASKSKGNAEEPSAGPVLLMDIGHHKTNLSIFDENRLEHFRSVAWGGASVSDTLKIALGTSLEEAEERKIRHLRMDVDPETTVGEGRELLLAAHQAFHPFLADINHSLVAYRTLYKKRVASCLITGGTSKTEGIESYLSRSLGIPVSEFPAFRDQNLRKDLDGADPQRFGEALGRAMVFARKAPVLFNFRRQAAAKGTSIREVSEFLTNPHVRRLLGFSGILLAALFIHVNVASYIASREAALMEQEVTRAFRATFPTVPARMAQNMTQDVDLLRRFVEKKTAELNQQFQMVAKQRTPILQIVKDISEAFPREVRVDVNDLTLDDRTFVIEGTLYEGDLNLVTESLKQAVSLDKVSLKRDGERFVYRGEVVGR